VLTRLMHSSRCRLQANKTADPSCVRDPNLIQRPRFRAQNCCGRPWAGPDVGPAARPADWRPDPHASRCSIRPIGMPWRPLTSCFVERSLGGPGDHRSPGQAPSKRRKSPWVIAEVKQAFFGAFSVNGASSNASLEAQTAELLANRPAQAHPGAAAPRSKAGGSELGMKAAEVLVIG